MKTHTVAVAAVAMTIPDNQLSKYS